MLILKQNVGPTQHTKVDTRIGYISHLSINTSSDKNSYNLI